MLLMTGHKEIKKTKLTTLQNMRKALLSLDRVKSKSLWNIK